MSSVAARPRGFLKQASVTETADEHHENEHHDQYEQIKEHKLMSVQNLIGRVGIWATHAEHYVQHTTE